MEEEVEVDVMLDKPTVDALNKMTKKELIERICSAGIEAETYKLRCQVAIEDANRVQKEAEDLQTKLDKAEAYVEQGRAMIESIMERWYHYDT